ncbi:hypothetical protein [Lysobacter gummosus]|uniref:hypothetical protein n=1 Tax=Lysobacter gummosus TaxID=262324 RepID=UPI00362527C2
MPTPIRAPRSSKPFAGLRGGGQSVRPARNKKPRDVRGFLLAGVWRRRSRKRDARISARRCARRWI